MDERTTHQHAVENNAFGGIRQTSQSSKARSFVDSRSTNLQFPKISGVIVYSFAIPILTMLGLGFWIDAKQGNSQAGFFVLVTLGLGLGLLNAWHSAVKADREFRMDQEEHEG